MKHNENLGEIRITPLKKRRRAVTRLPDWVIRIKGWLFARRGGSACDAEIDRLQKRCLSVEHKMCEELEQAILRLHVDCSLCWLKTKSKDQAPQTAAAGSSPIAIRAAAAAKARCENSAAAAKAAGESIVRINEMLISAEHSFYQNVESLRAYTGAKINAFVTGVRSRKKAGLAEYRVGASVMFDGTAYSDYRKVHEANERIRAEFLEKLKEVI